MTEIELLTAANPLTDEAASRLPIDAAEREMLDALVARSVVAPAVPAPRARRRLRHGRAVIGTLAVAVPVIAVIVLLPTARRAGHAPTPAPAPPTAHARKAPASTSPQVLFARPGWHVWYADEDTTGFGELDFARDGATIHNGVPSGGGLALTWFPASDTRGYVQDRAAEASIKTTQSVLGATAHVIQYRDGRPGHPTYSAIWISGTRGFEFRASAANMRAFKALLAHVTRVDEATWLKAMPPSVVTPAHRSVVIRTMLRGIPLPPGFGVSQIPGATLVRDRYQLGSAVTGVVACEWFARWGQARKAGDSAAVRQAVAAMQTAKHWPVLEQMDKTGAWGSVLLGYVKAMPSGRWFKRPLLGDVDSGLGCSSEWHIKLLGAKEVRGLRLASSS
jgi:hypothetical protein